MTTSQNGWSASKDLPRRGLTVNGVSFVGGIRDNDDVEFILRYFVEQYAERVEPLVNPGCWGFYFRPNVNDPSSLSNHSSGTAIDINAPQHPNGVAASRTFAGTEIYEIHKILAECHGALRWGGDYTHTVDGMHVEINVSAVALHGIVKLMHEEASRKEAPRRPKLVREALKAINEQEKVAGPTQDKKLQEAEDALKKIQKR